MKTSVRIDADAVQTLLSLQQAGKPDLIDKIIGLFESNSPDLIEAIEQGYKTCLLYTSPSPRDRG